MRKLVLGASWKTDPANMLESIYDWQPLHRYFTVKTLRGGQTENTYGKFRLCLNMVKLNQKLLRR